jgi:hypothetical protein
METNARCCILVTWDALEVEESITYQKAFTIGMKVEQYFPLSWVVTLGYILMD